MQHRHVLLKHLESRFFVYYTKLNNSSDDIFGFKLADGKNGDDIAKTTTMCFGRIFSKRGASADLPKDFFQGRNSGATSFHQLETKRK